MKFENAFVVAGPDRRGLRRAARRGARRACMPGAEVLEKTGDDAYKVAIKVKVGPMSMTYKGDVEIVERDDAAHTRDDAGEGEGGARAGHRRRARPHGARRGARRHARDDGDGRRAQRQRRRDGPGRHRRTCRRDSCETFAGNLAEMLEGGRPSRLATAPRRQRPRRTRRPRRTADGRRPSRGRLAAGGRLVASVVAGRLSDPKALFAGAGIFAMICLVIGYLVGRRPRPPSR